MCLGSSADGAAGGVSKIESRSFTDTRRYDVSRWTSILSEKCRPYDLDSRNVLCSDYYITQLIYFSGVLVMGIGSITFSLPHFLSGHYMVQSDLDSGSGDNICRGPKLTSQYHHTSNDLLENLPGLDKIKSLTEGESTSTVTSPCSSSTTSSRLTQCDDRYNSFICWLRRSGVQRAIANYLRSISFVARTKAILYLRTVRLAQVSRYLMTGSPAVPRF